MPARCDVCGVESTLEQAFHRFQITRRKARVYCPSCWEKRNSAHSVALLILAVAAGIAGVVLFWLFAEHPWSWGLLGFCLFIVFEVISTLPHELGHAVAAWLVGMRVFTVSIGWFGRVLFVVQVFGHDFVFRSIPAGGSTVVAPRNTRLVRLKYFVVLFCGPLANCMLIVAALCVGQKMASNELVSWLVGVFILSNVVMLAITLWPWSVWAGGQRVPSDGLALLTVAFWSKEKVKALHASYFYLEGLESRERGRPDDAIRWFEKGLEEYPDEPLSYLGLNLLFLDEKRYREARDVVLKLLERQPSSPEVETIAWNNLAWADLMIGSSDLLAEADRFSQQAFERLPWMPSVKGTRGSVLVECGEIDLGIELLQAASAKNDLPSGRAFNACYLALAMLKRNDGAAAKQYLEQARRLDPKCPVIERVVRQLGLEHRACQAQSAGPKK